VKDFAGSVNDSKIQTNLFKPKKYTFNKKPYLMDTLLNATRTSKSRREKDLAERNMAARLESETERSSFQFGIFSTRAGVLTKGYLATHASDYPEMQTILEKSKPTESEKAKIERSGSMENLIEKNILYRLILSIITTRGYEKYNVAKNHLNSLLVAINSTNSTRFTTQTSLDEGILKMVLKLNIDENKSLRAWLTPLKTRIREFADVTEIPKLLSEIGYLSETNSSHSLAATPRL
jgi:hypothetical protein